MNGNGIIIGNRFLAVISTLLEKIAKRNQPPLVLILGESGTGKGLLAEAIHLQSKRRGEPFVVVNCGAFSESLVESELFGHVKGSYTGAHKSREGKLLTAGKGTLFLDEIGDLPIGQQVKLLHVIDSGTFYPVGSDEPINADCRIICATNRDLQLMVSEKKFREDLFWRINVLPITIPPLRNRIDDLPELLDYFVEKHKDEFSTSWTFSFDAKNFLQQYHWPGNIRELENFAHRLCILADGQDSITAEDAECLLMNTLQTDLKQRPSNPTSFDEMYAMVLNCVLLLFNRNVLKTAAALKITRSKLNYVIKKYGANDFENKSFDTPETRRVGETVLQEINGGKIFNHVISTIVWKFL